ncbi:MAG: aminoacyl-tRNA hydrolase [Chloroflexi bacterium]|nr:aminoacyl-tRNA hydrolase [Chloroflexota bacterium]MYC47211.1 aminoacyl-tRNA hydrolase [Chloroflexota bacterium]
MGLVDLFRRGPEPERLLVFLGNPGREHAGARHNIGWRVGRKMLADNPGPGPRRRYRGRLAVREIGGDPVGLLFPHTFMNASGKSVRAALGGLGLATDRLVVIHDDMDLGFASLRVRFGGSAGGHRGIRSIIAALGTNQFLRFKLGIGRPPPGLDPAEYVLQGFTRAQKPAVERMVAAAQAGLSEAGIATPEQLMNRFNRNWADPH